MLKVLLIAIIILSSVGLGNSIISQVKERHKLLKSLMDNATNVKNEMLYENKTLEEALENKNPIFSECRSLMLKNPHLGGKEACRKALENVKDIQLKENEMRLVESFMSAISSATMKEQIGEACKYFVREFGKKISEMEQVQLKRVKVVKTMCVLCGLVVAIVLV